MYGPKVSNVEKEWVLAQANYTGSNGWVESVSRFGNGHCFVNGSADDPWHTKVAYADGTAEATNGPALERLREQRNARIGSYQKATQTIREVLADSTIQNSAEEAAARLQKFLSVWSAQPHHRVDIVRGIIEAIIRDLKLVAGRHLSGEPELLQPYAAEKDQYTSFVSKHVELKGAARWHFGAALSV